MEAKKHREKSIPEKKLNIIKELAELMKGNRSLTIASIKNLPSSQFQAIKKKLRNIATIKVAKKRITERIIEIIPKGTIKNLKPYLREDTALIFSGLNPFELSSLISKNKSMSKAKVGQTVSEDIAVETGPTDLVPGPVISELGALGLKFAIEDGKINIKERKVIVKANEPVKEQAASIMSKLAMKPIALGLEPLVAYDAVEDKIYDNIKIDLEKTLSEIKQASAKALAFAVKIAYPCKDTLKLLLAKALINEKTIEKLIKIGGSENV